MMIFSFEKRVRGKYMSEGVRQGGREAGRQGGREAGRQGGREAGRQGGEIKGGSTLMLIAWNVSVWNFFLVMSMIFWTFSGDVKNSTYACNKRRKRKE